jgi:hypothetical protein
MAPLFMLAPSQEKNRLRRKDEEGKLNEKKQTTKGHTKERMTPWDSEPGKVPLLDFAVLGVAASPPLRIRRNRTSIDTS